MHQYLRGQWAASTYAIGGERTDHSLFLSPDGTFGWAESGARHAIHVGQWRHDSDDDVMTLDSTNDMGEPVGERWTIH